MKFAEVDGLRREAFPRLSGKCRVCGAPTIAKCGQIKAWHWSHNNLTDCDHWWEPETQWHRNSKNQFPEEWQEIIHLSADGEKHIADVKTPNGVVIEFQYSFMRPDERRVREAFYGNMVWVVHGTRRARDKSQFFENRPTQIGVLIGQPIYLLASSGGVYYAIGRIVGCPSISTLGITKLFYGDLIRRTGAAPRLSLRCRRRSSCTATVKDTLSRADSQRKLSGSRPNSQNRGSFCLVHFLASSDMQRSRPDGTAGCSNSETANQSRSNNGNLRTGLPCERV